LMPEFNITNTSYIRGICNTAGLKKEHPIKCTMLKHYILTGYLLLTIVTALVFSSKSAAANVTGNKQLLNSGWILLNEKANIQAALDVTGIIDELREPRLKKILSEVIKIKGGKIGKIIAKLESHSPNWSWIVRDGSLPENVNGRTKLISQGAMTILDCDQLKNATNLSIARTIIHEMVHVYLSLYFRYEQTEAIRDYPLMYSSWQLKKYADYNQIQHDEIEKTFLIDIASALKEYGEKTNVDANDNTYNDLAWGGLNVQHTRLLSAKEKRRVQIRLSAEQSNHWSGLRTCWYEDNN
jgi:hypothetical protein